MNGALDHLTPPRYGARVARTLPNAKQLALPQRGHDDTDPCVSSIIEAFVLTGRSTGLDTRCAGVSPAGGAPSRRGGTPRNPPPGRRRYIIRRPRR
jgi:hypothetical protein